jgi:hypothetical protein
MFRLSPQKLDASPNAFASTSLGEPLVLPPVGLAHDSSSDFQGVVRFELSSTADSNCLQRMSGLFRSVHAPPQVPAT